VQNTLDQFILRPMGLALVTMASSGQAEPVNQQQCGGFACLFQGARHPIGQTVQRHEHSWHTGDTFCDPARTNTGLISHQLCDGRKVLLPVFCETPHSDRDRSVFAALSATLKNGGATRCYKLIRYTTRALSKDQLR